MSTLIYLLQVSACTGIFFVFYKLVLSRFTFFTINRWYLLAVLVVSFMIPAVTIPVDAPQPLPQFSRAVFYPAEPEQQVEQIVISPVKPIQPAAQISVAEPRFKWQSYLTTFYLLTAIAIALKLGGSVIFFFVRLRKAEVLSLGNIKVVKGDARFKNGSFFNYVFLDEQELSRAEAEQILAHEMTHVRLCHSADTLFVRLLQAVLWFNPFIYFYKRAIVENHEFETDRAVTLGCDKGAYADLLLRLSVSPDQTLYSHFSMIPLKKRITMLFTNPTKKMKKVFYLLVLPLVAISCLAFAKRDLIRAKVPVALKAVLNNGSETPAQGSEKLSLMNVINTVIGTEAKGTDEAAPVDSLSVFQVSGIPGVSRLGKHPLVKIDDNDEFVDPEILYKINPRHIGYAIRYPDPKDSMFGRPIPDGGVHIATANKSGNYTLMTDLERENVIKISKALNGSVFTRVRLKREDGSDYDMLILRPVRYSPRSLTNMELAAALVFKGGSSGAANIMGWEAKAGGKAAFYLNGPSDKKVLDETQLDELASFLKAKTDSYNGIYVAERTGEAAGVDLSAYDVVFEIGFKAEGKTVLEDQDTVNVKNLRIANTLISTLTDSRIFTGNPRPLLMNSSFTMIATEIVFDAKANTLTGKKSGGPPIIFLKQRQDAIQADSIKISLTSGKVTVYNKRPIKKAADTGQALPAGSAEPNRQGLKKTITRDMDLQYAINKTYDSPKGKLIDILMEAIDNGTITAYSSGNEFSTNFASPLKAAEAKVRIAQSGGVGKFRLLEEWTFDKQRSVYSPEIIGLAPMINTADGQKPAFWLSFAQVNPVLSGKQVLNRYLDPIGLSYSDMFVKRIFASSIVKESSMN